MTSLTRRELAASCGALIVGGFDGPQAPREFLARIRSGHLGGVILFARNIEDPPQVAELCRELHAAAPADRPLWISVDQEGGRVQRLRAPLALWPPMARLGAIDDEPLTRCVGAAIGDDLRALGIDIDFAPVLDVVDNAENTVIADRAFGSDAATVARHGVALARGLADAGVIACGKHFPGHGGPIGDSHLDLPCDSRPWAAFDAQDLLPFTAAIAAGVPLLMVAHVVYPDLDATSLARPIDETMGERLRQGIVVSPEESPATFSEAICTGLLRERLGFEGVLVSDDLEMGAITRHGAVDEAALLALYAGIGLFLVCHRAALQEATRERFIRAIEGDEKAALAVAQSLDRLDGLRARHEPSPHLSGPDLAAAVDSTRHAALLARLMLV